MWKIPVFSQKENATWNWSTVIRRFDQDPTTSEYGVTFSLDGIVPAEGRRCLGCTRDRSLS